MSRPRKGGGGRGGRPPPNLAAGGRPEDKTYCLHEDGSGGRESVARLLEQHTTPSPPLGFLEWAMGCSSEQVAAFQESRKGQSLKDLFAAATESGRIQTASSLSALPEEMWSERESPRPAGYPARTVLYFGGKPMETLLDYGATSSAIPEEVACILIEYTLECVEQGTLTD